MFIKKIAFNTSDNPVALPGLQCLDKAAETIKLAFHIMIVDSHSYLQKKKQVMLERIAISALFFW